MENNEKPKDKRHSYDQAESDYEKNSLSPLENSKQEEEDLTSYLKDNSSQNPRSGNATGSKVSTKGQICSYFVPVSNIGDKSGTKQGQNLSLGTKGGQNRDKRSNLKDNDQESVKSNYTTKSKARGKYLKTEFKPGKNKVDCKQCGRAVSTKKLTKHYDKPDHFG